MQQKLMFGLGLSAAVADADGAGYLGLHESTGAQQLRSEYLHWCTGLAAEYLHRFQEPASAKQAIRTDFTALATGTDTGKFTDEETILIENFVPEIDAAVDRLAAKSSWQRTFALWGFRTPHFVKILVAVAIVVGVAVLIIGTFS